MTAPLYLLDTSILLHLARGSALGYYVRSTFELDSLVFRPLVSIVTHGEVWVLADRKQWGSNKRAECQQILQSKVTVQNSPKSLGERPRRKTFVCRFMRKHWSERERLLTL